MFTYQRIREEDYWIYPIVLINIVCITVAIYTSVIMFRGPAVIIGFLGIWFTSSKIHNGYSPTRAKVHVGLTILAGLFVTLVTYLLTN